MDSQSKKKKGKAKIRRVTAEKKRKEMDWEQKITEQEQQNNKKAWYDHNKLVMRKGDSCWLEMRGMFFWEKWEES